MLVIFVSAILYIGPVKGLRGTWTPFQANEYFISEPAPMSDWSNYAKARLRCKRESGMLAIVNNSYVQSFLTKNIPNNGSAGRPYSFLIGLRDPYKNGTYIWDDGVVQTWGNWAPYEPNNYESERCASFGRHAQVYNSGFRWNNVECDTPQGFICQRAIDHSLGQWTEWKCNCSGMRLRTRECLVTTDEDRSSCNGRKFSSVEFGGICKPMNCYSTESISLTQNTTRSDTTVATEVPGNIAIVAVASTAGCFAFLLAITTTVGIIRQRSKHRARTNESQKDTRGNSDPVQYTSYYKAESERNGNKQLNGKSPVYDDPVSDDGYEEINPIQRRATSNLEHEITLRESTDYEKLFAFPHQTIDDDDYENMNSAYSNETTSNYEPYEIQGPVYDVAL